MDKHKYQQLTEMKFQAAIKNHSEQVTGIAFSKDKKKFVTVSNDKQI